MNPFLWLLDTVITLYIWVLIASAVLSWLVAFNVVNPYNTVVRAISGALYQLTEPLRRPIRNGLPNLGGLDISPVILILILMAMPLVLLAATDSRHFVDISDQIFKFSPVRARSEDLARFHGTNERISVDNLAELIRFYHRLLTMGAQAS